MTKRKDSETFFYFLIFFLVVTIIVISIYGVSKVFNKLSGTDKEVMIEIAEQNCNELDAELISALQSARSIVNGTNTALLEDIVAELLDWSPGT